MTLDQLAELAALSKGHLSRFERGEKSMSVAAMMRLAAALGTSMGTLLGERIDEDRIHLVRRGERGIRKAESSDGGYAFSMLSRTAGETDLNVFVLDVPGKMRRVGEAYHGGEEAIFVLDGTVAVDLAGNSHILQQGDYLQFPGHVRHVLRGVTDTSQVLVVISGS